MENGILPGLFQEVPFFSYRNAPPVLLSPEFTNVGAHRIDLTWAPPGKCTLRVCLFLYSVGVLFHVEWIGALIRLTARCSSPAYFIL